MRKSEIAIAVFAVIMAAASATKAEGGALGNLADTSDKISSIDMNKNFSEAGKVLETFYTGMQSKGDDSSSVVYAEASQGGKQTDAAALCNAAPSKIVLSGKVPPLGSTGKIETSDEKKLPVGTGVLTSGTIALAISGRKKGYFSNYGEDLDTVTDFLIDLVTTDSNPKPPPPNENYDVHPSGNAPTCNGENYCTRP